MSTSNGDGDDRNSSPRSKCAGVLLCVVCVPFTDDVTQHYFRRGFYTITGFCKL